MVSHKVRPFKYVSNFFTAIVIQSVSNSVEPNLRCEALKFFEP